MQCLVNYKYQLGTFYRFLPQYFKRIIFRCLLRCGEGVGGVKKVKCSATKIVLDPKRKTTNKNLNMFKIFDRKCYN